MNNDLHIDAEEITGKFDEYEPKPAGYNPKLSIEYVLSRIDAILNDTEHIHKAIKEIPIIPMNSNSDCAGQKANAIAETVQSRETTNQQLIRLLEKMYDDLNPKESSEEMTQFQQLADIICKIPPNNLSPEMSAEILQKSAQQMFVKPGSGVVK